MHGINLTSDLSMILFHCTCIWNCGIFEAFLNNHYEQIVILYCIMNQKWGLIWSFLVIHKFLNFLLHLIGIELEIWKLVYSWNIFVNVWQFLWFKRCPTELEILLFYQFFVIDTLLDYIIGPTFEVEHNLFILQISFHWKNSSGKVYILLAHSLIQFFFC